ncbi:MAG: hypothetical protein ACKPDM_34545, partial [Dolichospermum sp.]
LPNENIPLVWAQSLYYLGEMLSEGLISLGDIDPLGRHLSLGKKRNSFFKMLNEMMAGRLQQYIGISGYAQSLLHFGPKVTQKIEAQLEFEFGDATYKYHFSLRHAAGDTLIFGEENLSAKGLENNSRLLSLFNSLGSGHQESKMIDGVAEGLQTAIPLNYLLSQFRVYHFHDTSSTSAIRQSCYVGYNKLLMSDAGNLAALLLRFREYD